MSENTCVVGPVVADTIMPTAELGVTIHDAAIDGDTTVVFCELIYRGTGPVSGVVRHSPMCEVDHAQFMSDRTTVVAIARELGLSWDSVYTFVVDATTALVAAGTNRFDDVRVIGVNEHRWAHTRGAAGDGFTGRHRGPGSGC